MASDGLVTVSLRRSTGATSGNLPVPYREPVTDDSRTTSLDRDERLALLALAERLALEAGALVLDGLHRSRTTIDTKSSATDMVTEMDRASEQLIVAGIRAARPGDGVLGEEGASSPGTSGVLWVIDPIDGTTNYVYALPGFAVSIGVEVGGVTVAGVVHAPAMGDTFAAALGEGATLNGAPITVSGAAELATALVATGFSYSAERRERQALGLVHVLPRVRDIRRGGSAAIDLCSVACGRVDAYYEAGLKAWDLSAGDLIAREAGAITGAIGGGPARPGAVVAASPLIYEPLQDLLLAAGITAATTR